MPIFIKVGLAQDTDKEDGEGDNQMVVTPFYPFKKMANWWLVVGDSTSHQLFVIKHETMMRSLSIKLEFTLPKEKHSVKLYILCDSYTGADHDIDLDPIDVAEGEESDSDDDMNSNED